MRRCGSSRWASPPWSSARSPRCKAGRGCWRPYAWGWFGDHGGRRVELIRIAQPARCWPLRPARRARGGAGGGGDGADVPGQRRRHSAVRGDAGAPAQHRQRRRPGALRPRAPVGIGRLHRGGDVLWRLARPLRHRRLPGRRARPECAAAAGGDAPAGDARGRRARRARAAGAAAAAPPRGGVVLRLHLLHRARAHRAVCVLLALPGLAGLREGRGGGTVGGGGGGRDRLLLDAGVAVRAGWHRLAGCRWWRW